MVVRPRFSIFLLMAIVFFVATDIAIGRSLWDSPDPYVEIAVTTLPMINLLLLSLPKLRRSGSSRLYWMGFQIVGWLGVILVTLLCWFAVEVFFSPIELVHYHTFKPGTVPSSAVLVSFVVLFYSTPQVLAAMLGGWLSARYRIVIERRS